MAQFGTPNLATNDVASPPDKAPAQDLRTGAEINSRYGVGSSMPDSDMDALVEFVGVQKSYDGETLVVKDLNLRWCAASS